jgi:hypothetical protein
MSFEEKYQEYLTAVQADDFLKDKLTSQSSASVFRNLGAIFSKIASDFDDSFFDKINLATDIVQNLRPWSVAYYKKKALEFQFGDQLVEPTKENSYQQYYEVIDEQKQIIKFFALEEQIGQVFLKLGKEAEGLPTALNETELTAVRSYFDEIVELPNFLRKPVTGESNITSIDGDIATIGFRAFLDPKKYIVNSLDTSKNGTNILTGIKDLEVSINNIIIKKLKFGGELFVAEIESEIFKIAGVTNFVVTAAEGKKFDGTLAVNILTQTNKSYKPVSGFFATVNFGNLEYLKS